MTDTALLRPEARAQRLARGLVVESDPVRRRHLTEALSPLAQHVPVVSVADAAEARQMIGARTAGDPVDEHWYVVVGTSANPWSTLVLLEWIRGRAGRRRIEAAFLTDTAAELLPVSVVDFRPRLLPASPRMDELRAWVQLGAG